MTGHCRSSPLVPESVVRAKELEAYEAVGLEENGEIIRLILAEASMLSEKYRYVRRHDVPVRRCVLRQPASARALLPDGA